MANTVFSGFLFDAYLLWKYFGLCFLFSLMFSAKTINITIDCFFFSGPVEVCTSVESQGPDPEFPCQKGRYVLCDFSLKSMFHWCCCCCIVVCVHSSSSHTCTYKDSPLQLTVALLPCYDFFLFLSLTF